MKTEEDFDKRYTYDTTVVSTEFDPESQAGDAGNIWC